MNEKPDHFFVNSECAAKVKLAFGFNLKSIENGGFRLFYAHENNTLLDRSKLVCTNNNLANPKDNFNTTDVKESFCRKRLNTKWRFYKFTNLTVFAVLFRDLPLCCKDTVLPKPLLKNQGQLSHFLKEYHIFRKEEPYEDSLCLFRALTLHLDRNQKLEEETSKIFNLFVSTMDELSLSQFQGVYMKDIPIIEQLLFLNILLYDFDIVEGNNVGELVWRKLPKYENTVRLLRYNLHLRYVSNINAVIQSFPCPISDTFSNRLTNLEPKLITCSERVKKIHPRNVYQIPEAIIVKLDCFEIKYTTEQKLIGNLATFDFESFCVDEQIFIDTNTTTSIGKHLAISISISSNLVEEPIFFCNSDLHYLVASIN